MHLNQNFIVQWIDDEQMLIPVGDASKNLHGIVKSNRTAAFIIDQLKNETNEAQLVSAILNEYDTDEATAENAVKNVLEKLRSIGAVIES